MSHTAIRDAELVEPESNATLARAPELVPQSSTSSPAVALHLLNRNLPKGSDVITGSVDDRSLAAVSVTTA